MTHDEVCTMLSDGSGYRRERTLLSEILTRAYALEKERQSLAILVSHLSKVHLIKWNFEKIRRKTSLRIHSDKSEGGDPTLIAQWNTRQELILGTVKELSKHLTKVSLENLARGAEKGRAEMHFDDQSRQKFVSRDVLKSVTAGMPSLEYSAKGEWERKGAAEKLFTLAKEIITSSLDFEAFRNPNQKRKAATVDLVNKFLHPTITETTSSSIPSVPAPVPDSDFLMCSGPSSLAPPGGASTSSTEGFNLVHSVPPQGDGNRFQLVGTSPLIPPSRALAMICSDQLGLTGSDNELVTKRVGSRLTKTHFGRSCAALGKKIQTGVVGRFESGADGNLVEVSIRCGAEVARRCILENYTGIHSILTREHAEMYSYARFREMGLSTAEVLENYRSNGHEVGVR